MKKLLNFYIASIFSFSLFAQKTQIVQTIQPIEGLQEQLSFWNFVASEDYDTLSSVQQDTAHIRKTFHRTHFSFVLREDTILLEAYENSLLSMQLSSPSLVSADVAQGDTIKTTFFGEGSYGHNYQVELHGCSSLTRDAEGQLYVVDRQYPVFRQHLHRNITISGAEILQAEEDMYCWFSPYAEQPLVVQQEYRHEGNPVPFSQHAYYFPLIAERLDSIPHEDNLLFSVSSPINNLRVSPNPVTSEAVAWFDLQDDSSIRIMLFSSSGWLLHSESLGRLEAGEHSYAFSMSSYPQGTYQLYVIADNVEEFVTVIKD